MNINSSTSALKTYVEFPKELKVWNQGVIKNSYQLKLSIYPQLMKQVTRENFKIWAQQHSNFVSASWWMRHIVKMIHLIERTNCPQELITLRKLEEQFFCKRLEIGFAQTFNQQELTKNFDLLSEYLRLGHLRALHSLFYFNGLALEISPICFYLDKEGQTFLHDPDLFSHFMRDFSINPEHLKTLLSLPNRERATPLHQFSILKFTLESILLHKLSTAQLVDVLSPQDESENTPLHYSDNLELFLPYLATFDIEKIEEILAIRNAECSLLQLVLSHLPRFRKSDKSNPMLLSKLFSLITKNKDNESIVKCLTMEDSKGMLPLSEIGFLKESFAFLNLTYHSNREFALQLLTLQDRQGNTCFHYPAIFKESSQFLVTLVPSDLIRIFSTLNKGGGSPLHDFRVFQEALPFFKKLAKVNTSVLVNLLSIKNSEGKVPLDSAYLSILAKDFLEELSPGIQEKILRTKTTPF